MYCIPLIQARSLFARYNFGAGLIPSTSDGTVVLGLLSWWWIALSQVLKSILYLFFFSSWECNTCRSCPEFQPEIVAPSLMMPSHLVISSPVVWHSRSRCLSLSRGMIGKSALPLQTPIATEPVSCGTAAAFRIRYFPWTCWWPEFVVVVLVLLFPFGISKWSSLVAWLLLLQLGHSSAHHLLGWKWYGYFQSYSNSIWFGKFFICLYPILNFEYSISLTNAYLDSKSYVFMVATSIIILFGKN